MARARRTAQRNDSLLFQRLIQDALVELRISNRVAGIVISRCFTAAAILMTFW